MGKKESHFSTEDRDILITMHANVETITRDAIAIKEQTIKTNGRVDSLERSRTQIWTAVAIIMFFSGVFITLSLIALDSRIEKGVRKVLSEYQVDVQ